MLGGNKGTSGYNPVDISKYLINFNSTDWANQANNYLTSALNQGLNYSNQYNQAAIGAVNSGNQQAQQALQGGYQTALGLQAPQRLATYNALDAYQRSLGLPTPQGGSAQLANTMTQNPSLFGNNNGGLMK